MGVIMNSSEIAEARRNEHPGIMWRGDTRFRPSKADRDVTLGQCLREILARLHESAHAPTPHETRQIARALEQAMNAALI